MNYEVPFEGSLNSKIAIIGEQPAKYELRSGRPFTGPAGKNLDDCLRAAKIDRNLCSLHNVISTVEKPLSDYLLFTEKSKKRDVIVTSEGQLYVEKLKNELARSSANIFVVLGNVPLAVLTSRIGITNWRGSVVESTLLPGRKVISTFHPASYTEDKLYKNPAAFLNKYLIILDLQKALTESSHPEIITTERNLKIKPSFYESVEFLTHIKALGSFDEISVDYDIELVPGTSEIACISFSYDPKTAICIPFVDSKGDYFDIEQEVKLMTLIGEILENEKIKKRGQNLIFDSHLLFRKYGIQTKNKDDTMIAQKILYPEFRVGLNFITSMWTDIPYYKQDGKIWLGGVGTYEQGWQYNCLDSISCGVSFPKQKNELLEQKNLETYERQVKLIEPLTYMMEHGIKINLEGMEKKKIENETKIKNLTESALSLIGKEINLNSTQQVQEYFYGQKGLIPYTKDGKVTANETALKRIAAQGHLEASLILEVRKLKKQNSTFLSIGKADSDGRMRCSYNPVGTRYGRISSSENIFGTGMNLQNVPHEVLTYFIADKNYVIYELDYSQYENRIVAYIGNIPQMIYAFENGLDSHRITAALVLTMMGRKNKSYETITNEDRQDFGKRPNHAFNYGYGPNSFSIKYETSVSEAKSIYNAYHSAYPGLENGYWKYVQNCLRENRILENLRGRKVPFLGKWSDKLLHEAYSCIPQGTCGDCMNERGIIFTYFNEGKNFQKVELLTQVHDSMAIQVPLDLPLLEHAKILIEIKKSLEAPLEFKGREIQTPVDLVVNSCLNKDIGQEIKSKDFSENPEKLCDKLEIACDKLNLRHLPF